MTTFKKLPTQAPNTKTPRGNTQEEAATISESENMGRGIMETERSLWAGQGGRLFHLAVVN